MMIKNLIKGIMEALSARQKLNKKKKKKNLKKYLTDSSRAILTPSPDIVMKPRFYLLFIYLFIYFYFILSYLIYLFIYLFFWARKLVRPSLVSSYK